MTVQGKSRTLTTSQKVMLSSYREVWFHQNTITNVLSLKNMWKKFPVMYDGDGKSSIIFMHKDSCQIIDFQMHHDGLHYHDTNHWEWTFINTVRQNQEGFTKKHIKATKKAREF